MAKKGENWGARILDSPQTNNICWSKTLDRKIFRYLIKEFKWNCWKMTEKSEIFNDSLKL